MEKDVLGVLVCFSGGGVFVKVSGWVVVCNCAVGIGLVLCGCFWELVGDRMMFVRDEFFYHTVIWFIRWCLIIFCRPLFGGVKCRICAGCGNFSKAHNLYYV